MRARPCLQPRLSSPYYLVTLNRLASSSSAMCLALPWEVIERVIDHCADNTRMLYMFALTCRDLNPRSTITLYRHLKFQERDQILALCDVLRDKPHLRQCVQSVSSTLDQFSPHPLLHMLPHLSEIKFHNSWHEAPRNGFVLNQSIIRSFRGLRQHIRFLTLRYQTFRSLHDFLDILQSFPRIQSLSCRVVRIKSDEDKKEEEDGDDGDAVHQKLATQVLGRLNDLRTLDVSTHRHHSCFRAVIKHC